MEIEGRDIIHWPSKMRAPIGQRDKKKYYRFHRDHGHDIEDYRQLKDAIEHLIRQGYLGGYVRNKGKRLAEEPHQVPTDMNNNHDNLPMAGIINMISSLAESGMGKGGRGRRVRVKEATDR